MTTDITPTPAPGPSTPPPTRRSKAWTLVLIGLLMGVTGAYEWRYSDDMEEHIVVINREVEARTGYSGGLFGALANLTSQPDVAREIMETQQHVHTLKDWMLARKIMGAVEQSGTVGEAIGRTIAVWQSNFAEHHQELAPTTSSIPQTTPAAATTPTPSAPQGIWKVDHNPNAVTGVVTTVAVFRYQGKRNIYIRQQGSRAPDCYIDTDEFLETVQNMESATSTVQYRIDDGKVVRQSWGLGQSNTSLFYPGNCGPFIAKLRSAKRLSFEYKPAGKIAGSSGGSRFIKSSACW